MVRSYSEPVQTCLDYEGNVCASERILNSRGINARQFLSTSHVSWWWFFWIIGNILGNFYFRYAMRAETIEELITSTQTSMVINIWGIPLALLAIKVIKDYSKAEPLLMKIRQEQLAANEGTTTPQPQQ
nr:DUF4328 domain-containing protein [Chryseobacterium suipulveris]